MIFAIVSLFTSKSNQSYNHPEKPSEATTLENETTVIKSSPEDGYIITYIGMSNGLKTVAISNSYPSSRISALTWLRAQDYDISNTKIVFSDFNNPFVKEELPDDK